MKWDLGVYKPCPTGGPVRFSAVNNFHGVVVVMSWTYICRLVRNFRKLELWTEDGMISDSPTKTTPTTGPQGKTRRRVQPLK